MRRYVYRDHRQCTMGRRRELREPIMEELGERPRDHMTYVQFPTMPMMRMDRFYDGDVSAVATMHRHVFETVSFTTMIWVEECTEAGVSLGHYRVYSSYFQVPEGVELPNCELVNVGHTMHDEHTEPYRGLDGEAYYRYRMYELQRQLDRLQNTRPIVTEEELRDMQHQIRAGEDKPVRVFESYFDDNIFEVE